MSQLATALRGISGGIQAFGEAEQRQRQEQRAGRQQDAQQLQQLIQIQQPIINELAVSNPGAVEPHVDQLKTQNAELLERMGLKDLKIFSTVGGSLQTETVVNVTPQIQKEIKEATGTEPELGDRFVLSTNSKTGNRNFRAFELVKGLNKDQRKKGLQALVSFSIREADILKQRASLETGPEQQKTLAELREMRRRLVEEEIPSYLATGKISNRKLDRPTKESITKSIQQLAASFGRDKKAFRKLMEKRRGTIEGEGLIFDEVLDIGFTFMETDRLRDLGESLEFFDEEGEPRKEKREAQTFPRPVSFREEEGGEGAINTTAVPQQTVPPAVSGVALR